MHMPMNCLTAEMAFFPRTADAQRDWECFIT